VLQKYAGPAVIPHSEYAAGPAKIRLLIFLVEEADAVVVVVGMADAEASAVAVAVVVEAEVLAEALPGEAEVGPVASAVAKPVPQALT